MNLYSRRALYWIPRGLCIVFGIFLSLFALDVFQEGLSFWEVAVALLIHLVPVYIFFAILAVAWRWEWVGTLGLTALAGIHLFWASGRHLHWQAKAMIDGPLFFLAVLFMLDWLSKPRPSDQNDLTYKQ